MKSLKKILFPGLVVILLGGMVACNNSTETEVTTEDSMKNTDTSASNNSTLSAAEASLIKDLVAGNIGEIKAAQMAKEKSANAGVKEAANMLETDHTAVLNDLKSFATKYNVEVPVEEDAASKDLATDLSDESGAAFDKKWTEKLIDKHEKTISKVESADVTNAELKNWAAGVLPKLKAHRDHLVALKDKLK